MSRRRNRHINRTCYGNPPVMPRHPRIRPAPVRKLADMTEDERRAILETYEHGAKGKKRDDD